METKTDAIRTAARLPWRPPSLDLADPSRSTEERLARFRASRVLSFDRLEAVAAATDHEAVGHFDHLHFGAYHERAGRRWLNHYTRVRAGQIEKLARDRRYEIACAPSRNAALLMRRFLFALDVLALPTLSGAEWARIYDVSAKTANEWLAEIAAHVPLPDAVDSLGRRQPRRRRRAG